VVVALLSQAGASTNMRVGIMTERWLGIEVNSSSLTIVDAKISATGPQEVVEDHTWELQREERPEGYDLMARRLSDYCRENKINRALVKATALSRSGIRMGHMEAAELRGVVLGALAGVTTVRAISKAHMSRTFGERKVDEYVADDVFWATEITGRPLRKGSREAALMLISSRNDA
jgi:hypothetical protein